MIFLIGKLLANRKIMLTLSKITRFEIPQTRQEIFSYLNLIRII